MMFLVFSAQFRRKSSITNLVIVPFVLFWRPAQGLRTAKKGWVRALLNKHQNNFFKLEPVNKEFGADSLEKCLFEILYLRLQKNQRNFNGFILYKRFVTFWYVTVYMVVGCINESRLRAQWAIYRVLALLKNNNDNALSLSFKIGNE